MPGASQLTIELMDHDNFGKDELIGKTKIDIEKRYFSKSWRSFKEKPIEIRDLYVPTSNLSQGSVVMWLEIHPKGKILPNPWPIVPKLPADFELRVVVWEASDVPRVDTFEDSVDIYVTGKVDGGPSLKTDTHFRSMTGKGSFNWRMVFPIKLSNPAKNARISFQIWDKDIVSKDDYISEVTFDFEKFATQAFEQERSIVIRNPEEKFWLDCTKSVQKDGVDVEEVRGKVLVSMTLIPIAEAEIQPVGQGRSNPNQNPFLAPPIGRFQFSLNPIKLIEQIIGPVARGKFYKGCALICCIVICAAITPMVIANGISNIIF